MKTHKFRLAPLIAAALLLAGCNTNVNLTGSRPYTADMMQTTEASTEETTAASVTEATTESPLPEWAVSFEGHSYYVYNADHLSIEDYDEASDYCFEKGGYLAEISSEEENDFIFKYVTDEGYKSAYFGLLRNPDNGVWSYPNGSDASYKNWGEDQPDSGFFNNYAKFGTAAEDGSWVNDSFGINNEEVIEDTRVFVCEWDFT